MFKKAAKESCLKENGNCRSVLTKGPIFSLRSQQKRAVCNAKRKRGGATVLREQQERQMEEPELSKWYCQKIRRAIWLWLMLRVTHRYFWHPLRSAVTQSAPLSGSPGHRKPTTFPCDVTVKHARFLITFPMSYIAGTACWYELNTSLSHFPILPPA